MTEAFQLACVTRSRTNWGHVHITGIGTVPTPGSDDHWPVAAVIARIEDGDLFYVIGALGDPAFVRPFRCFCGFATITAKLGEQSADPVDGLPACDPACGAGGDPTNAAPLEVSGAAPALPGVT